MIPLLSDQVARVQEFSFICCVFQHSTDGNATGLKGAFFCCLFDIWHNWGRQRRKKSAAHDTSEETFAPRLVHIFSPTVSGFKSSEKSLQLKWYFHFAGLKDALLMTHSVPVKQSIDSPCCLAIVSHCIVITASSSSCIQFINQSASFTVKRSEVCKQHAQCKSPTNSHHSQVTTPSYNRRQISSAEEGKMHTKYKNYLKMYLVFT